MSNVLRFPHLSSRLLPTHAALSYAERTLISRLIRNLEERLVDILPIVPKISLNPMTPPLIWRPVRVFRCETMFGDCFFSFDSEDVSEGAFNLTSLEELIRALFPLLPRAIRCTEIPPLSRRSVLSLPIQVSWGSVRLHIEIGLSKKLLASLCELSSDAYADLVLLHRNDVRLRARVGVDLALPLKTLHQVGKRTELSSLPLCGFIELIPYRERQYCSVEIASDGTKVHVLVGGGRSQDGAVSRPEISRKAIRGWLENVSGEGMRMDPRSVAHARSQSSSVLNAAVHVQVELGELHLTVEELLELRPGTRFRVDLPPSTELPLRVGGEEIGVARLASDGGESVLIVTELSVR